jgi:hypothetical protein
MRDTGPARRIPDAGAAVPPRINSGSDIFTRHEGALKGSTGGGRNGMPEPRPYRRSDDSERDAEIAARVAAVRLEARRRRAEELRDCGPEGGSDD